MQLQLREHGHSGLCHTRHKNLGTKRPKELQRFSGIRVLELNWSKAVYELTATIIGGGEADRKEGTYLGRTIRWQEWGLELEGNEKHVEELLRCTGMETCKPVNSPMTAEDFKDDDRKKTEAQRKVLRRAPQDCIAAAPRSQSTCRRTVRILVQQHVSSPREKRLCRYVKGCPRCVLCYPWQHEESTNVKLTTGSDWANEARTRKSHSGGLLQIGHHLVQHWCRRQPVIALSSGEAELYSSVCGLTRMLGLVNVLREMRGKTW